MCIDLRINIITLLYLSGLNMVAQILNNKLDRLYRVHSIVYLDQLSGARHARISNHDKLNKHDQTNKHD